MKKINSIIFHILKVCKVYFCKMLLKEEENTSSKDLLLHWKNKIFFIAAVAMIICGGPLMFFGAYHYDYHGEKIYGNIERVLYLLSVFVITRKALSIEIRKLYINLVLYLISIFLLITTGLMGSGMVFIVLSLILTGCLLEKKQIYISVTLNLIIFGMLTFLIMNGYFDNTYMKTYKEVWLINAVSAQVCGIVMIFLMNTIYGGLEKQNKLIKKSQQTLFSNEIRHRAMITNISDVIVITDENFMVKYCSPNLERRFGWSIDEIINKSLYSMISPEDRFNLQGELEDLMRADGLERTLEAKYFCKNGSKRYIEITAVNLIKDDNIKGILINYHDITDRKIREGEILQLSYCDSLTGVFSRMYFENEKKKLDIENQLPLSVIIGDINGLKIINDSMGHAEGDKLLKTISVILNNRCREGDILARLGGDEFGILLPRADSDTAAKIIEDINWDLKEYNKKVSGELYIASISLGYAVKTTIDESLDNILKAAEGFMYKRKLLETRSFHSSIISSMKTVLFERSQETEEHAQRLVKLTRTVGQAIRLTNQQFDELELFSSLHDIGKIAIDDAILNKQGKLTASEWVEMKKHSEIGYRIAMASPELMPIANYILTHHERWDGNGYPQGLTGDDIPLLSRILSVADAYDAMVEDRVYRKGMPKQQAMDEIIKNAGTQFDPNIAKIFIDIIINERS